MPMETPCKTRLFVDAPLAEGARIEATPEQFHYLSHILRLKEGQSAALFNGRDGEWRARLAASGRKAFVFELEARLRGQKNAPDIWLAFAPVKNEKIDYTVKRATELGVSRLLPVMTRRTIVSRVNTERLLANAVEAAEQSGRMDVPALEEPQPLPALLDAWTAGRRLFFCDESGGGEALREALPRFERGAACGVLIGPEGGFTGEEQALIRRRNETSALSLGPRILRAETAALAALANIAAWLGDWDERSAFSP